MADNTSAMTTTPPVSSTMPPNIDFSLSTIAILLWSIPYLFLVVTAIVGNLVVVWIVLAHKRMRTVTNYFLVNLAISDIFIAIFNVTFNAITFMIGDYIYGSAMCRTLSMMGPLFVIVSVLTLSAISADRFRAIVMPMMPRMSKMVTKMVIVSIWTVAVLMCLPIAVFSEMFVIPLDNGTDSYNICVTMFFGDQYATSDLVFRVTQMLVTYVVPLVVMTIAYSIIGVNLWGNVIPGETSNRYQEQLVAKRKIVKMMVTVVVVFAICWMPFHITRVLENLNGYLFAGKFVVHLYLAIFWFAMSHSMYNPFIYCYMNDRFRRGFRKCFRCCPFVKWAKNDTIDAPKVKYVSTYASRVNRNGSTMTTATACDDDDDDHHL